MEICKTGAGPVVQEDGPCRVFLAVPGVGEIVGVVLPLAGLSGPGIFDKETNYAYQSPKIF